MKKITKIGSLMASLFFILSCGGGGGEEVEEVFAVSGEVTITDAEYWSAQEEIRFGVFKPGKMNPFSSVKLTKTSDGKASFYVKDIVAGTYEFKIYVAKNGMNTVDLLVYNAESIKADKTLAKKSMTLVSYGRVQKQVFNGCVICHGGSSGEIASNLNLLAGKSYSDLVSIAAKNSDLLRVKPFSIKESFMVKVLNNKGLSFEHSASISTTNESKKLIENWILKGAFND